ncbi:MAG: fumarylacetoacetate hydrolase family protein [Planctomycetota bacterium]|nr:fumarylacetoacetate hydrolase family protein [Planctomycetota bacterium]
MQLTKVEYQSSIRAAVLQHDTIYLAEPSPTPISDFLEAEDFVAALEKTVNQNQAVPRDKVKCLAPLDQQEVWAAGVTYKRSKSARMEESETAASCYDRVYVSPRPELFFKATPNRVVGPNGGLRIRCDSHWNVPEPELTLVINSRKELVGFTIGNDMSSRDIEGDNPLYLPQAKLYDECCGLGPAITPASSMPEKQNIAIDLRINRDGVPVFSGHTDAAQMAREFNDLLQWLGRDNTFPAGAMLLTGTGIVPNTDFTLHPGDQMEIEVTGIGILSNHVIQG